MGFVPHEICNRLVYSSLTDDSWFERSSVLKFTSGHRKPASFLSFLQPIMEKVVCFDCIYKLLVACSLIMDSLVA